MERTERILGSPKMLSSRGAGEVAPSGPPGIRTSGSANKFWGVVGQVRTPMRVCSQPAGHMAQLVLLLLAQDIHPWPQSYSEFQEPEAVLCALSRPHPDPA